MVSQCVRTINGTQPGEHLGASRLPSPRPGPPGKVPWNDRPPPLSVSTFRGAVLAMPAAAQGSGKGETSEARRMQDLRRPPSQVLTAHLQDLQGGCLLKSLTPLTLSQSSGALQTSCVCLSVRSWMHALPDGWGMAASPISPSLLGSFHLPGWEAVVLGCHQPVPVTRPLGSLSRD